MAKFYRPRGHHEPAVLWDPASERPIYEFYQGVFETEDKELIARMRKLGFSEKPISTNIQVAMDRTQDASKPVPPPPPRERSVPAIEPKVTVKRAPAQAPSEG